MLIDKDGSKLGLKTIDQALNLAVENSMDLVQVSPNGSDPLVCKIMDYGKHLFSKKKNISPKSKTKQSLKEIKFRPSTDTGDYKIKLKIKSYS